MAFTVGRADGEGSPIFGVKIPPDYRQWRLIAGSRNGFGRAQGILGNALSTKAYHDEMLPFPEGAIRAKLAWKLHEALVTWPATTVQIMVKDSQKYTATGAGGSAGSSTANLSTRRSMKHASPVVRPT